LQEIEFSRGFGQRVEFGKLMTLNRTFPRTSLPIHPGPAPEMGSVSAAISVSKNSESNGFRSNLTGLNFGAKDNMSFSDADLSGEKTDVVFPL
jgi:hypothetical protein